MPLRDARGPAHGSDRAGGGGFGTPDINLYVQGLRHQEALESILTAYAGGVTGVSLLTDRFRSKPSQIPPAMGLAPGDPRAMLP